jgi:hypothetical protein
MSALATNYIVNNGNYSSADLNTIFSPISKGSIDYGSLDVSANYIAETWCIFKTPGVTASAGNITTIQASGTNGGGFNIVNAGFYRLNIALFFNGIYVQENIQKVLFILNSSPSAPISTTTTFTPSPSMNDIYIMNCSGVASGNTTDVVLTNLNNERPIDLNSTSLGNLLSTLDVNTDINTNPYYFSFFASSARSNIYTLDITFNAIAGQDIYPQIVCQGFGGTYNNPANTLDGTNSKWAFFRL